MDISTVLAAVVIASLGVLTGVVVADLARKRRDVSPTMDVAAEFAELRSALETLQVVQSTQLDTALSSQHQFFAATAESLRHDTSRLMKALSRSEVRGRWGEMQLRRLVESHGLLERVHFTEQVSIHTDDGVLRPDMIIHLSENRSIVVDAKVPLDAVLAADDESDPAVVRAALATAVSNHLDRLAKKEYWRQYETSPDFVVMFLPAESFLAEALTESPDLLDRALDRKVMLATPTTLHAMLRTVAQVVQQEALSRNAAEIQSLGTELYGRLTTVSDHLAKLGRSLKSSVEAYNTAVGSFDSRLVVTARRMHEHGIGTQDLSGPEQVTSSVRTLGAIDAPDTSIRAV